MAKAVKFTMDKFKLEEVFKEDFLKKIKDVDKHLNPIHIVFMHDEGIKESENFPLIFAHTSLKEVNAGVTNIECPNEKILKKIIDSIEVLTDE
ncbi:MAG: hypothetical protein ACLFN8_00250 [Candidatus Woesearchaeota archaeon]